MARLRQSLVGAKRQPVGQRSASSRVVVGVPNLLQVPVPSAQR
jgi:hypothetical protein